MFLSLIMNDTDFTSVLKCFKPGSVVKLIKRFMRNEGFQLFYLNLNLLFYMFCELHLRSKYLILKPES